MSIEVFSLGGVASITGVNHDVADAEGQTEGSTNTINRQTGLAMARSYRELHFS